MFIDIIRTMDLKVLEWIQNYMHHIGLDPVFSFLTSLGDKGFIWISIGVVLLVSKKHRRAGLMVIAALVLAVFLGEGLLKNLIQRLRPFIADPSLKLIISTPSGYSFPSGHTMSSFAAAGILANQIKKYQMVFWLLAFAISFSRLYLQVHYLSDVIVGGMLGLLCSVIVLGVFGFVDSARDKRE